MKLERNLWELINAACCDALNDDQIAELATQLEQSQSFRLAYYRAFEQATAIRFYIKTDRVARQAIELVEAAIAKPGANKSPVLGFVWGSLGSIVGSRVSLMLWIGAVLTNLGLVGLLALALSPRLRDRVANNFVGVAPWQSRPASPAGPSVARLVGADGCRWQGESSAPLIGDQLKAGRLSLAAGTAQIEFADGARMAIAGPSEFELISPSRAYLHLGQLAARVLPRSIGFTVVTPTAEIVDLGTEFAVEVDRDGGTQTQVSQGQVKVQRVSEPEILARRLSAGQAVRVSAAEKSIVPVPHDATRFNSVLTAVAKTQPWSVDPLSVIPLGNLFDDPHGTSLRQALQSDEFRAVAEVGDLGVDRVFLGGDPVKQICRGVRFDFSNLGWGKKHYGQISNDTWIDEGVLPGADFGPDGGIQTLGKRIGMKEPKIEEGIGSHACAMVGFDLDVIRAAGDLGEKSLVFKCDRAGINDSYLGHGSVHMSVLACDRRSVLMALVDGQAARVAEDAGVWTIASPVGPPIIGDGRFVTFTMPLTSNVRCLILAVTDSGDDISADAAVWSGARLEIAQ